MRAKMPFKEDLRKQADRYLRMAAECTDVVTASLLRLLAADYLEAANLEGQQQIQRKKPDRDDT
jgi:hypothetical protein